MPKRKTPNGVTPRPDPFKIIRTLGNSVTEYHTPFEAVFLPFPEHKSKPRSQVQPLEARYCWKAKDGRWAVATAGWKFTTEWEYTGEEVPENYIECSVEEGHKSYK